MATPSDTAGQDKAADPVAEVLDLTRQLVSAAEDRAREEVAQRIFAILKAARQPAQPPAPAPERPPLKDVVHRESNVLFDVLALLRAAEERIDELGGYRNAEQSADYRHDTLRLVQVARERVEAVQDALSPYV